MNVWVNTFYLNHVETMFFANDHRLDGSQLFGYLRHLIRLIVPQVMSAGYYTGLKTQTTANEATAARFLPRRPWPNEVISAFTCKF